MALFSIATNFIKRPVLTTVCTIVILLVGGVCIPLLPINYLPDISPIQIQVRGESREFIRTWLPDSKLEDFVASASIEARKPA